MSGVVQTEPNPRETRARSAKAMKLARVCEAVLAEDASLTVEDVRVASDGFWARVAVVAGTREPSQATKDVCAAILRWRLGRTD